MGPFKPPRVVVGLVLALCVLALVALWPSRGQHEVDRAAAQRSARAQSSPDHHEGVVTSALNKLGLGALVQASVGSSSGDGAAHPATGDTRLADALNEHDGGPAQAFVSTLPAESHWIVMSAPRTPLEVESVARCCRDAMAWRTIVALDAELELSEVGRRLTSSGCYTVLSGTVRPSLRAFRLWRRWQDTLLDRDEPDADQRKLKNLAYLLAIAHGAAVVLDADHDCALAHQHRPSSALSERDGPLSGARFVSVNDIHPLQTKATRTVVNPLAYFDRPEAVPRGFPLTQHSSTQLYLRSSRPSPVRALVWQGVHPIEPDLHEHQLALNVDLRGQFGPHFLRRRPPVAVTTGFFAPINSRQTIFHWAVFRGLYLPSGGDIVRGYFMQRLLWAVPGAVAFETIETLRASTYNDTTNIEMNPPPPPRSATIPYHGTHSPRTLETPLDDGVLDEHLTMLLRWDPAGVSGGYFGADLMGSTAAAAASADLTGLDKSTLELAVYLAQAERPLWRAEDVQELRTWLVDLASARGTGIVPSDVETSARTRARGSEAGLPAMLGDALKARTDLVSTTEYRGFAPPGALWARDEACVAPRPTIDILLKTRDEDTYLLLLYLQSQRLLLPRYLYRQLVVPVADSLEDLLRFPPSLLPTDVRIVREDLNSLTLGKIGRQWTILWADLYTDADYILVPDTDQVYATHVNYHRLFRDGKPITRWSRDMSVHTHMYEQTQVYMLGSVKNDHMFELPVLMPRKVFPAFRAYVESRYGGKPFNEIFIEMLATVSKRKDEELVCQFCLLLQYASDHMKDAFHWVEVGQNATTKPFPWVARHIGYEHFNLTRGASAEWSKMTVAKSKRALDAITSGVCHHRYQHVPLGMPVRNADDYCRKALQDTLYQQPKELYVWEHHVTRPPEPFDRAWLGKFFDDDDDFDPGTTWRCSIAT